MIGISHSQSTDYQDSDRFHLNRHLSTYVRHKYLFLSILMICLILAFLFLWSATPLYRIQSTLVIKDEKKGESTSMTLKELDFLDEQKIVDNEAEIVKSASVISKVVTDLELNTSYYRSQYSLRKHPIFFEIPLKVIWTAPVHVNLPLKLELTKIDSTGYNYKNKRYLFGQKVEQNALSFIVEKTRYFNKDSIHDIKIHLQSDQQVIQKIKSGLTVSTPTKNSSILHISMLHPSPKKGAQILRKIIEEYNQENIIENQTQTDTILNLIEHRLSMIADQLAEFENREQLYKVQNRITNISDDSKVFLQKAEDIDAKIYAANIQKANLFAIQQAALNVSATNSPANAGIEDPILLTLLGNLSQLKQERLELLATTGTDNPALIAKNSQIEEMIILIGKNIELQKRNIDFKISTLENEKKAIDNQIRTVPARERNLLRIIREKNIRESIYTFLLQKREEASISNASAFSKMRVIDYPYSSFVPVKPNKLIIISGALLAGFVLPIIFINLKRELNSKISQPRLLHERFPTIYLGEIPRFRKFSHPDFFDSNDMAAEHFRALRHMIGNKDQAVNPQVIMITSSISLEGKTYISLNLAKAFAMAGKKTILVDIDFRNPQPSIPNTSIEQFAGIKNLWSFSLRPNDPQAVETNDQEFDRIFMELKKNYEIIIFHTAPFGLFSDALNMNRYATTTMLVFRHGFTPLEFIDVVDALLKKNQFNDPKVVYNYYPIAQLYGKNIYKGKYFTRRKN